jgi:hypothetical protein
MREDTLDAINDVCNRLVRVAAMIREDGATVVPTRDHVKIIKHYNHLRLAAAAIKESREAISEMEEQLSREQVPEVMREHNVKTITIEGVGRVTVSYRFGCSMLDKELGLNWLRENGHGGLIIETVNSSTLAAFAKSQLQDAGQELPTNIFKTSTSPYTSITKAGVINNGR